MAELEFKDTTYAPKCVNYLDIRMEFGGYGRLCIQLYDKRYNLYSLLSISDISEYPSYAVFVSQLARCAQVCSTY